MYNVFYILLFEKDTIKMKLVNKFYHLILKLEVSINKEYKVETIQNSIINTNKIVSD